jgi:hypothetical protein
MTEEKWRALLAMVKATPMHPLERITCLLLLDKLAAKIGKPE